ncbi:MAG: glutamate synthase subunit beta [Lachnospiraceae bacterium]|nr:glutamate synthase subunit beta [Lachnospiraceae bacterium]
MGKATGFMEYERKENLRIPPKERIKNFREFYKDIPVEERRRQGARCMDCGVPFCQSAMALDGMVTGCPLHNLIPEWNEQIYKENDRQAFMRLSKTSNFPEFTGRVCPALCEKACINGEHGNPVTIHDNERYIIEQAYAKGYIKPVIPQVRSGKRVAVIGSGPSGLAVADTLNHRGHNVEVFEREDRIGGLLMYGIPNMKLDKSVIARRQKLMEEEGVVFHTGVNVGVDITASDLKNKFDAVVLCCGAKNARGLNGLEAKGDNGIWFAVDFLKSTTKALLNGPFVEKSVEELEKNGGFVSAKGKHVVIVGGGDTGNDCIGTCVRHGAASVTALEMMPEPPKERKASNPWPQWPKILKTDYGHEEAAYVYGNDPRIFETTVKEGHYDKAGHLKEIVISKVAFKDGKLELVKGSEKTIPCELLLIAAGFVGCEKYVPDNFGVTLSQRNTVQTEADHYASSVKGVFTAGDMHRGQSLVVWGVAEGRACAREVDEYLMGYSNL